MVQPDSLSLATNAAGRRTLRFLYWADLPGVAVFAASGVLVAMAARLDLLGVLALASITAIGGGTLRDLLLNRHPIFWMKDTAPIAVIMLATVCTLAWAHLAPMPTGALLMADALGLALFALSGAQVAEAAGCRAPVILLMGSLTGVGGGLLRDVLTARVPMILREDFYASAALAGIGVYLVLRAIGASTRLAFAAGFATAAGTRLAAIALGWRLPVVSLPY